MHILTRITLSFILISMLIGCASLPEKVEHTVQSAITKPNSTLSELVDNAIPEQSNPNISSFFLLESGWDALSQRLALIETAEHSIDIQYYIWNSDASGRYLASRLIAAANRGVKVRVMLDDFNLNQRDDVMIALDHHPKIEIRIFNPIPSRSGVTKLVSLVSDFARLNRRMHNKSLTVDGALSIVGGRNIGDEYFDLSNEINFRDRDVLVGGTVVADIQTSFIIYWNSNWSYPVNLLSDQPPIDLAKLDPAPVPVYKNYPPLPEDIKSGNQLLAVSMKQWSWGRAYFVSDRPVPEDTHEINKPKTTARLLAELSVQAEQEILIESAYLILDDRQLAALQNLTKKGVQMKALTNSMASNDVLPNHSGYAGRREDMLDHGIQLFELKPNTTLCEASTKDADKCHPVVNYGLHSKSAVYDRKIATIGSFNFNLRSTYLNTESILVIENIEVAETLAETIEQAMSDNNSWGLNREDGDTIWHSGEKTWTKEPETGQWDRIKSSFLQLLPIEKYL